MEKEDKRGIFFGIIGVLTLIVAIIGASLAYFSINAQSSEDALTVQAATVQIVYNDSDTLAVSNIIPASKEVALETYRRYLAGEKYSTEIGGSQTQVPYEKCVDDKGYTVCGVYEFTLTNNGANPVDITAKVVPTALDEGAIEFQNLKFILYNITDVEGTNYGTQVSTGTVAYSEFSLLADPVPLTNGTTTKYRLFVWLDETNGPQDEEQGATFKGTVYINVPGAGNLTGTADKTLGN